MATRLYGVTLMYCQIKPRLVVTDFIGKHQETVAVHCTKLRVV